MGKMYYIYRPYFQIISQRTKIGFTGGSVYRRAHNCNNARNFNLLSYEDFYIMAARFYENARP